MSIINSWVPTPLYRFLAKGATRDQLLRVRDKIQILSCEMDSIRSYRSARPIAYAFSRAMNRLSQGTYGCIALRALVKATQFLQEKEEGLQGELDKQVTSKIKKIATVALVLLAGGSALFFGLQSKGIDQETRLEPSLFQSASMDPLKALAKMPPDPIPYDQHLKGDLEHCPSCVLQELQIADLHGDRSLFWEALAATDHEKRAVCDKLVAAESVSQKAQKILSEDCEIPLEKSAIRFDVFTGRDIDQFEDQYEDTNPGKIILADYDHWHLTQRLILAFSENRLFQFFSEISSVPSDHLLLLKHLYHKSWLLQDSVEGYLANNNRELLQIIHQYATHLFKADWVKWRAVYHKVS